MEKIAQLERWTLGELRPDLVLVLDLDPQLGLQRAKQRGDVNRFEAETLAFAQLVRQTYLSRAQAAPERYAVIDSAQPYEQVRADIILALQQRLRPPLTA
jgi:dTMP kinase